MKTILIISVLALTTQGFTQESDSIIPDSKQNTEQAEIKKQEQQETGSIKNPFQVGPYKNSQYEYFSDQDREAAALERERTQQSQ